MAENNVKVELLVTGNYDVDDDFGVDQATNVNFHKFEVEAENDDFKKEIEIMATAILCDQIMAKLAEMIDETGKDAFKNKMHMMKHLHELQMPDVLKNMLMGDDGND